MRARSRRCVVLALCACCLPVALRLLLLGRSYPEGSLLLEFEGTASPSDGDEDEEEEDGEEEEEEERFIGSKPYGFAGAYMAGGEPRNASYCRWQYGLPEALTYVDEQLFGSPESPSGQHRVLVFAIRGESESVPQVTLCSHASAEQVYGIVELARRWEGPLSFAVYAPGQDAGLAVRLLDRACRCEPAMARVSVHLVFPRDKPARCLLPGREIGDCAAPDLQALVAKGTERQGPGIAYPINVVRNVARSLAPTQCVLVSDVELLPSEALASRFVAMLRGRPPRRTLAFVLPVFEVEASEQPPGNKAQLQAALRAGSAVYFHRFLCPHCQRFPGLTRWILRPDPGRVRPLIITKREYPHHRWEPIFIGTKYDPLYTEEMSWEGRQDKMTQMFEMCLMNYRLIILDGAFLVHTPGIKRKPTDDQQSISELQLAHERQNARIYQRVTRRLLKKYPSNRRCRS
ncbi:PREDICTED: beta-1,4-glucuronyltransferase 1-like [Ceratosolen solmsi marchali]|uniref:Beta-1,4-glucuronyltransferase 1-like n=1 Tax=Ceratosolen solmsi marchali TaxID=326594 RepID=A0AAJ6YRY8_9HYME|nr:PREDICTED: beta-1,4-glucuronyltransferase 1-like [Ceratosolen solmsi marchali]